MNKWITVGTFLQSYEVHLAKTKLESEGIDVFLKDELSGQMYSAAAVFGIKLQVEEHNVETALHILKECGWV